MRVKVFYKCFQCNTGFLLFLSEKYEIEERGEKDTDRAQKSSDSKGKKFDSHISNIYHSDFMHAFGGLRPKPVAFVWNHFTVDFSRELNACCSHRGKKSIKQDLRKFSRG